MPGTLLVAHGVDDGATAWFVGPTLPSGHLWASFGSCVGVAGPVDLLMVVSLTPFL